MGSNALGAARVKVAPITVSSNGLSLLPPVFFPKATNSNVSNRCFFTLYLARPSSFASYPRSGFLGTGEVWSAVRANGGNPFC